MTQDPTQIIKRSKDGKQPSLQGCMNPAAGRNGLEEVITTLCNSKSCSCVATQNTQSKSRPWSGKHQLSGLSVLPTETSEQQLPGVLHRGQPLTRETLASLTFPLSTQEISRGIHPVSKLSPVLDPGAPSPVNGRGPKASQAAISRGKMSGCQTGQSCIHPHRGSGNNPSERGAREKEGQLHTDLRDAKEVSQQQPYEKRSLTRGQPHSLKGMQSSEDPGPRDILFS